LLLGLRSALQGVGRAIAPAMFTAVFKVYVYAEEVIETVSFNGMLFKRWRGR
jgi:hypothetical protein